MSGFLNDVKRNVLLRLVEAVEAVVFYGINKTPFIPLEEYRELLVLQENWQEILKEYSAYHGKCSEQTPFMDELSQAQSRIVESKKWQAAFLKIYGKKIPGSLLHFKKTHQLLEGIPGIKTAFFSIFLPGTRLIPHRGPYKGVLRYHLGLIIPQDADKCGIKIEDITYHWQQGQSILFDDTYLHEAWNDSSETRVVLFIDIERKLKFPFNLLNRFFLFLIKFSPFANEIYTRAAAKS